MKLGFGLYRHMLDEPHYRFAAQCGATHAVVHLVDYFKGADADNPRADQPIGGKNGWGFAPPEPLWTVQELVAIREGLAEFGLTFAAIENFSPAHWHDVLLDGPRRAEQIEACRELIRRVGEAGVPTLGYNFSLAGVASRVTGPFARGGATSVGMTGPHDVDTRPIPAGMAWNMVYDEHAPAGPQPRTTTDQLWDRVQRFLADVLPTAEKAGVALAAHPDDPPVPEVRQTPRLVYRPELYDRLVGLHPSPSNRLEFCLGTLAEMPGCDLYETTRRFAEANRIGYVHFRNVRGTAPDYRETFVDEGDIDMARILRILRDADFQGVLIPDHTPQMTCDAPWHAGMAYAMGWMKATLVSVLAEPAPAPAPAPGTSKPAAEPGQLMFDCPPSSQTSPSRSGPTSSRSGPERTSSVSGPPAASTSAAGASNRNSPPSGFARVTPRKRPRRTATSAPGSARPRTQTLRPRWSTASGEKMEGSLSMFFGGTGCGLRGVSAVRAEPQIHADQRADGVLLEHRARFPERPPSVGRRPGEEGEEPCPCRAM